MKPFRIQWKTKYKLCLYKAYWEKGYGLTHYIKYIIAIFGFATDKWNTTMGLLVVYFISCFFLGWLWYHTDFIKAEIEVRNQHDNFVKEMRKRKV